MMKKSQFLAIENLITAKAMGFDYLDLNATINDTEKMEDLVHVVLTQGEVEEQAWWIWVENESEDAYEIYREEYSNDENFVNSYDEWMQTSYPDRAFEKSGQFEDLIEENYLLLDEVIYTTING